MFRTARVTRVALLSATMIRRAAATGETATAAAAKAASADATKAPLSPSGETGALQHSAEESSNVPSSHVEQEPLMQPPHLHREPKFLFKGRRGSIAPEYYSVRSSAGHPDRVAEMLGAGRDDPEWMWLKLLCFLCAMSTFGTTLYGYFFAEHVKYFKDEPWSPFTY